MTLDEIEAMIESGACCLNDVWMDNIRRLLAVAKAAKEAEQKLWSADNGWVLDDVRDALDALSMRDAPVLPVLQPKLDELPK